jgi:hypothetical protein
MSASSLSSLDASQRRNLHWSPDGKRIADCCSHSAARINGDVRCYVILSRAHELRLIPHRLREGFDLSETR